MWKFRATGPFVYTSKRFYCMASGKSCRQFYHIYNLSILFLGCSWNCFKIKENAGEADSIFGTDVNLMGKVKLLIIYPIDEAIKKFGGIETAIQSYLTYAPDNFDFRIIGITGRNSGLKLGKWHSLIFNGKRVKFFPVVKVNDPNKRSVIPLTFRFCLGLLRWRHKVDFKNAVLIYHRLEPNYVLSDIKEKKVLFVHGNIRYFDNKYCESRWRKIRKLYYFVEPFFIKHM